MASIEISDLEGDMEYMNNQPNVTPSTSNTALPINFKEKDQSMQGQLTKMVWLSGKEKASHWFSVYGNIDLLRPYFDVEPREVLDRLITSLTPVIISDQHRRLHRELYGPSMVILTLISLLLLLMKTSDHYVEEGTLIGTAFTVCFGYWFGISSFIWFIGNFTNTHMTIVQILSLIGYSLCGHCLVILFGIIYHVNHSHTLFYICYVIIGSLSSARLVAIFSSKTSSKISKIVICTFVVVIHMTFLFYLHFAYHIIVEENAIPVSVMSELKKQIHNISKKPMAQLVHD